MTRMWVAASSILTLLLVSCGSPTGPSSSTTLDRFVQALRQQVLRHPFTFSRGLDQDSGVWAAPKERRQTFTRRGDTTVDYVAALPVMIRTWLSFLCKSIAPYSIAGLLSCASERVFALWSESYHLTKEASRFIISSGSSRFASHHAFSCATCCWAVSVKLTWRCFNASEAHARSH